MALSLSNGGINQIHQIKHGRGRYLILPAGEILAAVLAGGHQRLSANIAGFVYTLE